MSTAVLGPGGSISFPESVSSLDGLDELLSEVVGDDLVVEDFDPELRLVPVIELVLELVSEDDSGCFLFGGGA